MPVSLNFQRFNIANAPAADTHQPGTIKPVGSIAPDAANPLVKGLINLFSNDPGQKRLKRQCNQLLMTLAQRRAEDMKTRSYFAHVTPDGVGPNYLIRQIGYPLHPSYSTAKDANGCESIAGGYVDASACWQAWLASPGHKAHVLGLHPFWAEQIDFGVGYTNGGSLGHYWVIITAKS